MEHEKVNWGGENKEIHFFHKKGVKRDGKQSKLQKKGGCLGRKQGEKGS